MGDCRQVNHLRIQPITKVNSAFHSSTVGKLNIDLLGWVKVGRINLCRMAAETTF